MATDAFIQFKDSKGTALAGESTDDKFKDNWSDVLSWSVGASQMQTLGSGTGGAGTGKVTLHDFQFVKIWDKASPPLLKQLYTGEHFKSVQVVVREAGGGDDPQKPYLVIDMAEVFVSAQSISGGGDRPTESWTLTCGSIGYTYKPQKTDGTSDGAVVAGWDQITNKTWSPPGLSS